MNKNMRYYERIDEISDINILSSLVAKEYGFGSVIDTYELATGNDSEETKMHLEAGIFGLSLFKE